MSDRVVLNDPELGRLIARAARCEYGDLSTNIARVKDDTLMGGAVYQAFTGESIQMHVAGIGRTWANRDLLWVGYHYPFEQLGVERLFAQVPEDNIASQQLCLHAGWEYVARIEGVYRGGLACLVMKMERKNCRFLTWTPRAITPLFVPFSAVPEEV